MYEIGGIENNQVTTYVLVETHQIKRFERSLPKKVVVSMREKTRGP